MTIIQLFYILASLALAPMVITGLWCYAKRDPQKRFVLAQRLGYDPGNRAKAFSKGFPKIWIHAVSVGEVKAAESVIDALGMTYRSAAFLLTTTTTTGQQYAHRQLGGRATVCYAPVDLWTAVNRFLSTFRPDMLLCMETEIWPNWIAKAHRTGMKIVFLNGRLSSRSIRSYRRIRPLLVSVLGKVDAFSMISETDARRIIALGAPRSRVCVNGNVKTDIKMRGGNEEIVGSLKRLFAVDDHAPVFVAGSIRGDEMEMLIDVYSKLGALIPGLFCIIAPRHIEKASILEALAQKRGLACQRRTALDVPGRGRKASLIVLDTIGELRDVYSIATVVFGGASLVPLGGQNVLEAAIWAKPILFGPYMDDFSEAKKLLESCGGGICIKNSDELTAKAAHLLTHLTEAKQMGLLARQAVLSNQGAAMRHARVVSRVLPMALR